MVSQRDYHITEEESTIADEIWIALTELLRKAELERDGDLLRDGMRVLGEALMDLEVSQHLGAERYERTFATLARGHSNAMIRGHLIPVLTGCRHARRSTTPAAAARAWPPPV